MHPFALALTTTATIGAPKELGGPSRHARIRHLTLCNPGITLDGGKPVVMGVPQYCSWMVYKKHGKSHEEMDDEI